MAIFTNLTDSESAPIAVATKAQIFITGAINGFDCLSQTGGSPGEVVIQVEDENGVYKDNFVYRSLGNYELSFVTAKNIRVVTRNCKGVNVQVDVAA